MMQALFYNSASNEITWREQPKPTLESSTDAIVKPIAVAACDLDRNIASGRSPFKGEFGLGHEFTAEITRLGDDVEGLAVGDIVLASFQPACGSCPRCGLGHSSVCASVGATSMYGVGELGSNWPGAFADEIRVPWATFNLKKLPNREAAIKMASGADNFADGLRCVEAPLAARPGESVLVCGQGSIALYAVLCARFFDAGQITMASKDRTALEIAEKLGADCLEVDQWPRKLTSHTITVDCTNEVDGILAVIRSTAPFGYSTCASIYFAPTTGVPLGEMYMKGITLATGRVNSASQLDHVISLYEAGLNPGEIEPAILPMASASEALADPAVSRKQIFLGSE